MQGRHTDFVRALGSDGEPVWVHNDCPISGKAAESEAAATKMYPDGSIRTPDGKFASAAGSPAPGTSIAEGMVQDLRASGLNVVGEEVTVQGGISTRRFDAVVQDSSGRLWGIEIKSGSATKTSLQRFNDIHIGVTRDAPILGDGPLSGQKIYGTKTIYVK